MTAWQAARAVVAESLSAAPAGPVSTTISSAGSVPATSTALRIAIAPFSLRIPRVSRGQAGLQQLLDLFNNGAEVDGTWYPPLRLFRSPVSGYKSNDNGKRVKYSQRLKVCDEINRRLGDKQNSSSRNRDIFNELLNEFNAGGWFDVYEGLVRRDKSNKSKLQKTT
jgi:hypothetical protein